MHDQVGSPTVDGEILGVLDEHRDGLVPVVLVRTDGVGDVELAHLGLVGEELVGAGREQHPAGPVNGLSGVDGLLDRFGRVADAGGVGPVVDNPQHGLLLRLGSQRGKCRHGQGGHECKR